MLFVNAEDRSRADSFVGVGTRRGLLEVRCTLMFHGTRTLVGFLLMNEPTTPPHKPSRRQHAVVQQRAARILASAVPLPSHNTAEATKSCLARSEQSARSTLYNTHLIYQDTSKVLMSMGSTRTDPHPPTAAPANEITDDGSSSEPTPPQVSLRASDVARVESMLSVCSVHRTVVAAGRRPCIS